MVKVRLVPTLSHEIRAWRAGFRHVAGVDEVGRGPLAGPVVAAAVVLDPHRGGAWWAELRDSKMLSPARRSRLAQLLWEEAGVGVGVVSHRQVDEMGVLDATRLAMRLALEALPAPAQFALVDGLALRLPGMLHEPVVRGDACCLSIAAASIVAKVERDRMMEDYHRRYPRYGFTRNKGYGTGEHLRALAAFGPCELHRRSFAPVRACLGRERLA
jgi:ribonuclease HII